MRWVLWLPLDEEETLILEGGDRGTLVAYFHSESREGPWALRDVTPGDPLEDRWKGQLEGETHTVRWQLDLHRSGVRPFAAWATPPWSVYRLDRVQGWVEVDGTPRTLPGYPAALRIEEGAAPSAYGFLASVRFERDRPGTFAVRLLPRSFWRRTGELHWATPEFVLNIRHFRDHLRPLRWRTTFREAGGVFDLELWAPDRFVLELPEPEGYRYLSGLGTGWLRREEGDRETHRYFARYTAWVDLRTRRRLPLQAAEEAGERLP